METRRGRVAWRRGEETQPLLIGQEATLLLGDREISVRRRIAFRAERCGAVCLGVCVGIPAGSWSTDPSAELRVIADRGAGLIPARPAC